MDTSSKAESLQSARLTAGYTMEELATLMRVTRQAVSSWETGVASPGGPARIVLSQIFEVDLAVVDGWFERRAA